MSSMYPALGVLAFLLVLEPRTLEFLLYMLVCSILAGFDGVIVGGIFWYLVYPVKAMFAVFGWERHLMPGRRGGI